MYEMTTNELLLVNGGDLYSTIMQGCEYLFVGACGAIGGSILGAAGLAIGSPIASGIGAVAGGYIGAEIGQAIWNSLFK